MWRSDHNSLSEVIEQGVMTDTHPPLSHLFFYFWLKFAGDSAMAFKIPFILMGIISVWLVYWLGKKWFSLSTGLLSSSCMAVLQEPVMHSQIARPYAMGCFLILVAAFLMSKIYFSQKKSPLVFLSLTTGILLAMCALTHHFSMMVGLFLWCIFSISSFKKRKKEWFLLSGIALICYLPNFIIVKQQLKQKGIGTVLSVPKADFIIDYFEYVFHFSAAFLIIIGLIILRGLTPGNRQYKTKASALALSIFVLTFVCGYLYSTFVAPIMHYRMLYFALPFLLLFLFSFVNEISDRLKNYFVAIILFFGVYTLIAERHYFQYFYADGYKGVLENASYNKEATHLIAISPYTLTHQLKYGAIAPAEIINPDSSWTVNKFVRFVDSIHSPRFSFGFTMQYYRPPIEVMGMILHKYKYVTRHNDYFNSVFYAFDNKPSDRMPSQNRRIVSEIKIQDAVQHTLGNGQKIAQFLPENEFGYSCEFQSEDAIKNQDWMLATAALQTPALSHSSLVLEVWEGEERIHWQSSRTEDYIIPGQDTTFVYAALFTPDVLKKEGHYTIKAYIWNQGDSLDVYDLYFDAICGNRAMYGLYEPLQSEDLQYLH
jgi:hypothetical protein